MLEAAVFTLGVLAHCDQVDARVECRVALDGLARAHVGVKVERLSECEVEGAMARADGSCEGT